VTSKDIARAIKIYVPDIYSLKGKTTKSKSELIKIDIVNKYINTDIILHIDIMFLNGLSFLISVGEKIGLLMVNFISNRSTESIRSSLDIINQYNSESFNIKAIVSDGEAGVKSLRDYYNSKGIQINIVDKSQHVPIVERKIRQIKERARSIISSLPFKLTTLLIMFLVFYCVYTINLIPQTTVDHNLSPRELFTGRKLDYNRDCKVMFGEYCQIHEDNMISSSMKERTTDAIALVENEREYARKCRVSFT